MAKNITTVHLRREPIPMHLRLLGLFVCMFLLLSGCGKKGSEDSESSSDSRVDPAAQDSAGQVAPQAESGAGTVVKLLDPGAEPRTPLRYKFQAGRSEKMVMETSMTMAMEMGDQKQPETQVPTSRMTMIIDSKEISSEGDLRHEFRVDKVEVLPGPGANPMMVNAMKQTLDSMVGLSGSATVTSLGYTKDAEIKIPPGVNPQVEQSMNRMTQSMGQMSAPLPAEPVGKGARWQVTMPLEANGLKITQIATYTLSEIRDDNVKFGVTIEQSAAPQEVETPGAPGVKTSLESLESSGTGVVELAMTNMVPTSSIDMTTTNVVSVNGQRMKTTMKAGVKIHPGD